MRRPTILASTLALLAGLLAPAGAEARPRFVDAFALSGTPQQLARGSDGNIWVTLTNSDDNNTLARVKPDGTVDEFAPAAVVNPVGITSRGSNLWLTRNGGVIRVPVANPDDAQDFDINAITTPQRITKGPEGKLWTASGDQLVSFDSADPNAAEATTINGMSARGIAASGGRLFIADFGGQRIVRADPDGGDTKDYDLGGGPQEVASGPNGSVAYGNAETDPDTLGRIKQQGGPRTSNVPNSDPFGITFAPNRQWWCAEFAKDQLARLSQNGEVKQFKDLPDNSGPRHLAVGANETLWVGLETSRQVAKIKNVG